MLQSISPSVYPSGSSSPAPKVAVKSSVDCSSPSQLFIEQAFIQIKTQLRLHPDAMINPILKLLNHIGLKGFIESMHNKIQRIYESSFGQHRTFVKAQATSQLLEKVVSSADPLPGLTSLQEKQGLLNICKHRKNFFSYEQMFPPQEQGFGPTVKDDVNKVVNRILSDIEELGNPDSKRVIILQDGSKFFAVPGGWDDHYFNFGFKLNTDGTYEFILFNKGGRSEVTEFDQRLHGVVRFTKGDKQYSKAIIPIRVTKKVLQDRELLSLLVLGRSMVHSSKSDVITGKSIYKEICSRLLDQGKGEKIESEVEMLAAPLVELLKLELPYHLQQKVNDMLCDLMTSDPNFHSGQDFGTCGESNFTLTEKDMAPNSTRQADKLFCTEMLMKEVEEYYFKDFWTKIKHVDDAFKELEKLSTLASLQSIIDIKVELQQQIKLKREILDCYEIFRDDNKEAEFYKKVKLFKDSVLSRRALTLDLGEVKFKQVLSTIGTIENEKSRKLVLKAWKEIDQRMRGHFGARPPLVDMLRNFRAKTQDLIPQTASWNSLLDKIEDTFETIQEDNKEAFELDQKLDLNSYMGKKTLQKQQLEKDILQNNFSALKKAFKDIPEAAPLLNELKYLLEQEFCHAQILHTNAEKKIEQLKAKLKSPTVKTRVKVEQKEIEEVIREVHAVA